MVAFAASAARGGREVTEDTLSKKKATHFRPFCARAGVSSAHIHIKCFIPQEENEETLAHIQHYSTLSFDAALRNHRDNYNSQLCTKSSKNTRNEASSRRDNMKQLDGLNGPPPTRLDAHTGRRAREKQINHYPCHFLSDWQRTCKSLINILPFFSVIHFSSTTIQADGIKRLPLLHADTLIQR